MQQIPSSDNQQPVPSHEPMSKPISLSFIRNTALILCLIIVATASGWYAGKHNISSLRDIPAALTKQTETADTDAQTIDRSQPKNKNVDMSMFWLVWDRIEKEFLFKEKIDYQKMVYGATQGMTAALGDPYTAFYPPAENQTSKENLNGAFGGVGIELGYKMGNQLVVIAPIAGMPAEKAGVKAGDFILKIIDEKKNINKDTYNMALQEAVQMIRGEKGTKVKLTMLHDGANEPYTVELQRDEIVVPSVTLKYGTVVNGKFTTEATGSGKLVARLILSRFGDRTDEQWDKAVSDILSKKDQVGGVVLDVRNNPGGYMQGAVNLGAEFLPTGKVIVKQESSIEPDKSFSTERYGRLLNMPLVVLINKGSASASEILAGALRDYDRAQLVGETSFGKGIIQAAEDLSAGAGLHVTIARWLTPNGTWVHQKGLEPDVKVELDPKDPTNDTQLNKAAELVLEGK